MTSICLGKMLRCSGNNLFCLSAAIEVIVWIRFSGFHRCGWRCVAGFLSTPWFSSTPTAIPCMHDESRKCPQSDGKQSGNFVGATVRFFDHHFDSVFRCRCPSKHCFGLFGRCWNEPEIRQLHGLRKVTWEKQTRWAEERLQETDDQRGRHSSLSACSSSSVSAAAPSFDRWLLTLWQTQISLSQNFCAEFKPPNGLY